MYQNVKSTVKFDGEKSNTFARYRALGQGEFLFPFLFSMFISDLEDELILNNVQGLDLELLKYFY